MRMAILRTRLDFEQLQFTRIPNHWIRDQRLSLQAKGLLAQLLSHATGWSTSVPRLATENGCGEHTIRTAVRQLEAAGYLTRRQKRSGDGQFDETIWETASPSVEIPHAVHPLADNRTPKKTKEKKTKEKKQTPTPLPDDFTITDAMRQWATTTVPNLDIDWHTASFCDYWRARPSNAMKKDWVATWRNWMRQEFQRLSKQRAPRLSNAQRNLLALQKSQMGSLE